MIVITCVLCLILYLGYRIWSGEQSLATLPPGPKGWPLIGNALDIDFNDTKKILDIFARWSKQFSGIYTIRLMGRNVVVVSNCQGLQECLVTKSQDFAGRPYFFRLAYLVENTEEIVASQPTAKWEQLKKAAMNGLKMYGDGLQRLNDISTDIIGDLCESIAHYEGESFDINDLLHDATAAIITCLVYGRKLTDVEIRETVRSDDLTAQCMMPAGPGFELDLFPWLRHIPLLNKNFIRLREVKTLLSQWYGNRLKQQKQEWDSDNISGAMDYMIKKQKEHGGKSSKEAISDQELEFCQRDMIGAGIMTTSRALYAIFLLLLKNPDIQRQAQQEIDQAIGKRTPNISDRNRCPFIESMLLEALRYITHSTIGVPHETTTDTTLQGYRIPSGTQIWTDFYSLHHDPDLWDEPYVFKPNRFLDSEGKLVMADHPLRKQLFLFGAGRRVCIGETLSRNRMFLFVTMLLQKFDFISTGDIPDTDPRTYKIGIVLSPMNFKLCARVRGV